MHVISTWVDEIPQLFCQLNLLQKIQVNEYLGWKEQARWIRFEEQAEEVAGRWSKPHVASIPQTAIEDLKNLMHDGIIELDSNLSNMRDISASIAESVDSFFDNEHDRHLFANILRLPHYHHHTKDFKNAKNQSNLASISIASSIADTQDIERLIQPEEANENAKLRRNVNPKAEGATILVAPLDFVAESKIVFIRFKAATTLPSLFELNIMTRFMFIIIGPAKKHAYLFEIGRAMATCLADDLCKELFYAATKRDNLIHAVNFLNESTMLLPPSAWDPKIRIEPPQKYLSKTERKNMLDITEYLHDDRVQEESHADSSLIPDKLPFSGLITDIKRKLPWILSDITDCLNIKCIAATFYMYLVSLCSLVAFGALLGQNTDDNMA
jgi:solute carrier family 4 (anion exchanger) protein 1